MKVVAATASPTRLAHVQTAAEALRETAAVLDRDVMARVSARILRPLPVRGRTLPARSPFRGRTAEDGRCVVDV